MSLPLVWVWAEHHNNTISRVSLTLLAKARELARQLDGAATAALVAGECSPAIAGELAEHGADIIYSAAKIPALDTAACASFVCRLAEEKRPEVVLWGATSLAQEVAARAAARLNTGLTAHAVDLAIAEVDGQAQLVATVVGWGGNLALKIVCPERRPQMATVKPGILQVQNPERGRGEMVQVPYTADGGSVDIIELFPAREEAGSLEQAPVVVVAGWGLSSVGFKAAEELAAALGGVVTGTRPALDAGWVPASRMVGQSGKSIAPRLLVTLGVSGAAQFATGVLNAGFIIAVDKNPRAPIFEMADIGMVGDLKDILPLLTAKIKELKGRA